jgi:hypothetical protein
MRKHEDVELGSTPQQRTKPLLGKLCAFDGGAELDRLEAVSLNDAFQLRDCGKAVCSATCSAFGVGRAPSATESTPTSSSTR